MGLSAPKSQLEQRRPANRPGWLRPAAVTAGVLAVAMFVAATLSLTHGDEGVVGVLDALVRFARYLSSLLAVGGFVFLLVVRPGDVAVEPGGRRLATFAAVVGVWATLVAVPMQAVYLVGRFGAAVDPAALTAVLEAGFGQSVAVGLVGLALLAVALPRLPASAMVGAGAAGSLLTLGAFLLTGHTVVSEPQAVALSANLAHTTAGAVWLGGLVLLPLALRDRRAADDLAGGARLIGRFSTTATVALTVALAGGLALAWVEVRELDALATRYGVVLAVKVAAVAVVASLGAYNNRRLVPRLAGGDHRGWVRLTRVVRLEAGGLVGVVAITAVLVNITPARVDAGIDAQEVRIATLGADRVATLVVEPARAGANEVHLYVEGGALDEPMQDTMLRFVPPGEAQPAATVAPAQVGPGHWLHLGHEFDRPGQWRLEVAGELAGVDESVTVTVAITDGGALDH